MIKYICDHLNDKEQSAITNTLVYDDNTAYIFKYCTICGHVFSNMVADREQSMEYKEYADMITKLKEAYDIELKEKKEDKE